MNKKFFVWIAFIVLSIIGVITFYNIYTPNYPEGTLSDDRVTYKIDTQTIIASIDKGETNVFLPAPTEPEGEREILWPSGSFSWDQEDYLKVADALHQLVWDESLDNWQLIRAGFEISQCQSMDRRIDSAEFSFFQRQEGTNSVHGFWITPLYGIVHAGNETSRRSSGYTAKWKGIDLKNVKINNVNEALQIAEESGGRAVRAEVENECRISILLAPDRIKYDILSHPFTPYGWGWEIYYWSNNPNRSPGPLFGTIVDPYTAQYKVVTSGK